MELHNRTQGPAAAPDIKFAINDETFFRYLDRLKQLHDFLYQEAVPVNTSDSNELGMGDLRALYFDSNGRAATAMCLFLSSTIAFRMSAAINW